MNNNNMNNSNKRTFLMIRLLRKNGRMKAKELIKELGLKNTRSITIYKKYIEQLGYNIRSVHGYYGGYELIEKNLTNDEMTYIKKQLKNDKLFKKIEMINNRI